MRKQKLENRNWKTEMCLIVVWNRCASAWFDILAAFR